MARWGRARVAGSLIALAVAVAAAAPPTADAQAPRPAAPRHERRVALVVGNGAYAHGAALANPVNDARAMSAKLERLGFDVISLENADQKRMEHAIGQFSAKLGPDAVSLFYYAGHGIQVNGHNYLVPIDAEISAEQTVRLETIDVDAVIDQMSMARSRVNLVILDACRNNPFERRFRSISGGLASIEAPTGTLIAYATSPGKVAADGRGANGLYTAELLAAMDAPGAKVEDVFKRVRANVIAKSAGNQTPWEASSLTGDFYFIAPTTVIVAPSTGGAPIDREAMLWSSIKDSRDPALLQTYLDQFPQGVFAGAARVMIAELEHPQLAGAPAASDVAPSPAAQPALAPGVLAAPAQLSSQGLGEFERYRHGEVNKALAIPIGRSEFLGWSAKRNTAFQGLLAAMFFCNRNTLMPCHGYAVNDTIIEPSYAQFDRESAAALAGIHGTSGWPPFADEDREFGVAPTTEIRKTNVGAPTPTRLAGAKTVTTTELVKLLKSTTPPVLIDVLDENEQHMTLPTAWWWRAAGNYPNDEVAVRLTGLFGALLSTAVPKRDTPIVFFCHSSRCWLSHNAALRAIAAGYTNVLWYRGGIEAWTAAGLPLVKAVLTAQLW